VTDNIIARFPLSSSENCPPFRTMFTTKLEDFEENLNLWFYGPL